MPIGLRQHRNRPTSNHVVPRRAGAVARVKVSQKEPVPSGVSHRISSRLVSPSNGMSFRRNPSTGQRSFGMSGYRRSAFVMFVSNGTRVPTVSAGPATVKSASSTDTAPASRTR